MLLGFHIQKEKLEDSKNERLVDSKRDKLEESKKENQFDSIDGSKKGKSILKGDKRQKARAEDREGDRTTQITKTKGKILEEDQDTIEKSNRKGRGNVNYGNSNSEYTQFSILG